MMQSPSASEGLQLDAYSNLEVAVSREEEIRPSVAPLSIPHGLEAVHPDVAFVDKAIDLQDGPQQTICGLRRKTVWTAAVLALILVVIAAVVGGVLGGRKPHQTSSSPSPTSSTSIPSAPPTPMLLADSNLAAASWNETANGNIVMQSRVFYQDTDGNIRESAWNSSRRSWYASNLLGMGKKGSPIALAATAPLDSNFFVGSNRSAF